MGKWGALVAGGDLGSTGLAGHDFQAFWDHLMLKFFKEILNNCFTTSCLRYVMITASWGAGPRTERIFAPVCPLPFPLLSPPVSRSPSQFSFQLFIVHLLSLAHSTILFLFPFKMYLKTNGWIPPNGGNT